MSARRAFLRYSLGALAGLTLAPFTRSIRAADTAEIARLTPNAVTIAGLGGNVLAVSTREGIVVVDSGAVGQGDALVAALKGVPGGERIHTLFNTHWHLDQVGGNAALGRAGARIIAHEKTRVRLATDYYVGSDDRYERAQPAEARPSQSFFTDGMVTVADQSIEYGYLLEAHTDGDIYVRFTDSNVIAVGDAVSPLRDPELDWFGGGWIGGRVDSLARLLEISDAQTRFVPSYGAVVGRAEVQAEHDMMLVLFERMVELVRKGMSAEDILAAGVMDGLDRTFMDPLKFVHDAHKSLWAHHNTLSHDIV